ncbi:ribosomal protein L17 [Truncatella angustata]|uniref:Large ribosomal subunit protein bL17m n=1 Tax=Truncatella angustata TaxID=152316 RepID=A0A9P8UPC2_9PEZI|nr:ribosomal protein L17 [Truncatella angustata]KAH6655783.1 ribosomal protein L17 [Truncatella angustata]
MAGGLVKYRHLSRNSAHRQALLRNLVTSLVKHESIRTTWAKAKEAQRLADKLITLSKRDTETARRKATSILFTPSELMPKLFTTLRQRYLERPGGYTRVLRTEPKSTYDQAPTAILEFVDGPKDMRFHMAAATYARNQALGLPTTNLTRLNRKKATQFREGGKGEFDSMVAKMRGMGFGESPEEKRARHEARLEMLKEDKKNGKAARSRPQVDTDAPLGETAEKAGKKNVSVLR